jgi:hypothetical protein
VRPSRCAHFSTGRRARQTWRDPAALVVHQLDIRAQVVTPSQTASRRGRRARRSQLPAQPGTSSTFSLVSWAQVTVAAPPASVPTTHTSDCTGRRAASVARHSLPAAAGDQSGGRATRRCLCRSRRDRRARQPAALGRHTSPAVASSTRAHTAKTVTPASWLYVLAEMH